MNTRSSRSPGPRQVDRGPGGPAFSVTSSLTRRADTSPGWPRQLRSGLVVPKENRRAQIQEAPVRARTGALAAPGLLLPFGRKTKPKPNQGIDPYPWLRVKLALGCGVPTLRCSNEKPGACSTLGFKESPRGTAGLCGGAGIRMSLCRAVSNKAFFVGQPVSATGINIRC
jgi:hypothetical protein